MVAIVTPNRLQILVAPAIALACLGAIATLQFQQLTQLRSQQANWLQTEYSEQSDREEVQLELLQQMPGLGFDNLIANWTFLKFLQYFGDEPARKVTGYPLASDYFEVIVNRDPNFLRAYTYLSTATTVFAGQPERALALLEQGLRSLTPETAPQAYYIWREKALTELLFLGDSQAALKSFTRAADWASRFPDQESQTVAKLSRQTAQFLSRNPNSQEAQISSWFMVFTSTRDQRVRALATQRIQNLGGRLRFTQDGRVEVRFAVTN